MGYISYLKLEGIAGDCSDSAHRGWMTVDSFSHSLVGPHEQGARTSVSDVAFNRQVDRATPLLARATAEGRHFKEAVLELWTNGGSKFMELRLTNVRISNYAVAGTPQHDVRTPFENFMLSFEKIEWLYFPNAFAASPDQEAAMCRTAWSTDAKVAV
ncbi:MAG TPA: type VI secretion system tube protein Hcp [Planctomycetota bacterium]|nr:type VI secretion system tube protein Hcp [Planctomycetota bacterium]